MREEPGKKNIGFAHDMIDHGADIIHGHSAHIFQGIEIYHRKLIFYDTGDFVDDYRVDPELKNDHSFFYRVEISKQGIKKVRLIPVLISNYQVNLATGKDYEWNIKRIQSLSSKFGTVVDEKGNVRIKHEVIDK
jgi:poly-gamma-glutamate synthesis protein (capsule biosynthesis protein)